jgi:UDP-GlcNAc:undecaprenyl-phosphate GlcNAc-1-phosphate transferase
MLLSSALNSVIVFLAAFFGVIFLMPKLMPVAWRIGLVDHPNTRSAHVIPRPLVGGLGMIITISVVSFLFIPARGLHGFFAGLGILLLVGFVDDLKGVGHWPKFLAQIVSVALLISFSNTVLLSFGDLGGFGTIAIQSQWLAYGLTVFAVVGVINSVNMIDGLDGLAGGVSFIGFISFAFLASLTNQPVLMMLCLAFAGALLGFLRFNWSPSVLFMGDAGSLCLGFALCYMALALTQGEGSKVPPVSALLILAVPITDTLTLMVRRLVKGKNPFKADQYHLHHILLRYGLGRKRAVKVILGLSVILSGCGILGTVYEQPESFLFLIFVIYFTLYFISSFFIGDIIRYRLKFKRKREWCSSWPCIFVRHVVVILDIFHIFRKAQRYHVELSCSCTCHGKEGKVVLTGTVRNLSSGGFVARMASLPSFYDQLEIAILIPCQEGDRTLHVPVENVWSCERDNGLAHGFRFKPMNVEQEEILLSYLSLLSGKKNQQQGDS